MSEADKSEASRFIYGEGDLISEAPRGGIDAKDKDEANVPETSSPGHRANSGGKGLGGQGRSLELFFIDGRPDGMLTAEMFNWTGHVLMAPRTQIAAALARKEARYAGAYILLGELDGEPMAYIGEGDDIRLRIRKHSINKDWWTKVVLITSAANNLHKAHAQYLEARLVETAVSVRRMKLNNGNNPARPTLPEATQANMEGFLNYLFMVLPAIGIDMFLENARLAAPSAIMGAVHVPAGSPIFELSSSKHGVEALARLEGGEFIVEAGSTARAGWKGVSNHHYAKLHAELVAAGVVVADGDHLRFAKSYAFQSPSAAAAVVLGQQANGQKDWRLRGSSKTYRDWEQQQISETSVEEPS